MHKEDLCSNFVSLHLSLDYKDLDSRLYIEIVGSLGVKQIDLLSENLVVEKPLEKLTLKNLVFSLIICLLLYWVLKAGILL